MLEGSLHLRHGLMSFLHLRLELCARRRLWHAHCHHPALQWTTLRHTIRGVCTAVWAPPSTVSLQKKPLMAPRTAFACIPRGRRPRATLCAGGLPLARQPSHGLSSPAFARRMRSQAHAHDRRTALSPCRKCRPLSNTTALTTSDRGQMQRGCPRTGRAGLLDGLLRPGFDAGPNLAHALLVDRGSTIDSAPSSV